MEFTEGLRTFNVKVHTRERAIFARVVDLVHESIVEGSPLTGSPGQPVDTGFEKGSWQKWFPSVDEAMIATNVSYAPALEDGTNASYDPAGVDRPKGMKSVRDQGGGSAHIKSEVGGNHSVRLTIAGFDRIVAAAASRDIQTSSVQGLTGEDA